LIEICQLNYPVSVYGENAIRGLNFYAYKPLVFLRKNQILVYELGYGPYRAKLMMELPLPELDDLEFVVNS